MSPDFTRPLPRVAVIAVFIARNAELAREVCLIDDQVDLYNDSVFRNMLSEMTRYPGAIVAALQIMLVARNLERIADLATNLAEDVIYIVEARTVKHHAGEIVSDMEAEGEFDQ